MEKRRFEFIKEIAKDEKRIIQIQAIAGRSVSGNQKYFVIEEHLFREIIDEMEKKFKS